MSGYGEDGSYDLDVQAAVLRLIMARCPGLASEASTALRVPGGAARQMRLDRLIPRALADEAAWSAEDRELMAGVMYDAAGSQASRTRTLRFRVTPGEEDLLKAAAQATGRTLSDYLRDAALGKAGDPHGT
jgi:hypothetical protein